MDSTLKHTFAIAFAAIVTSLGATGAYAIGDPTNGKAVFARCGVCHRADKDAGNAIGPNLYGVIGRRAGTITDFNYSNAMKGAGFEWSEDKLRAYVQHPQQIVPGNRMPFPGLPDPHQAEDVVAYLNTLK